MEDTSASRPFPTSGRVAVFGVLVAVAVLVLPLAAYTVEAISNRAENWISVLQLVVMALVGGTLGARFRPLGPVNASTAWRVVTWSAAGLLAALLGAGVWLLLLGG